MILNIKMIGHISVEINKHNPSENSKFDLQSTLKWR